jgi:putative Holliday junction resolvase
MRLLGIDYGTKRVGVALSNEDGTMAFPLDVLRNDDSLVEKLVGVIEENSVEKLVIGHSLDQKGEENPVQKGAYELMNDLTLQTGLPIELEPEQYSTQEALRVQGRGEKTDASAAAIILNSYITRTKKD